MASGWYDKLTGRNPEITYEFENLDVSVPKKVGSEEMTRWNLNGKLKISTSENNNS